MQDEFRCECELMESLLKPLESVLVGIFFLGMLGSALVIVLMTIEDIRVLFRKDDAPAPSEAIQP